MPIGRAGRVPRVFAGISWCFDAAGVSASTICRADDSPLALGACERDLSISQSPDLPKSK